MEPNSANEPVNLGGAGDSPSNGQASQMVLEKVGKGGGETATAKQINQIDQQGYRKITFAADSGAFDHVVGEEALPGYQATPSAMSAKGESYVGAGGDAIPNLGQIEVLGELDNGQGAWIKVQKARVHRNLASISKIVQGGNKVIFDEDQRGNNTSMIVNKQTGKTSPIRLNGIYEFDMWIKDKAQYGQYGVLREEEDEAKVEPPPLATATRSRRTPTKICGYGCNDENCLDFHRHT